MAYNERNYGIDALRIIAMFMVVVLHVLGQGGVLHATKELSANYAVVWFLELSTYCAVNCYAIISGYVGYGRKIKYSNLVYLAFCVVFYIIIITSLVKAFVPYVSAKDVSKSIFHIFSGGSWYGGYWYVRAYFCAFFFFPHINFLVEKYEKKRLYILLGVMFILFSVIPTFAMEDIFSTMDGYSPLWLLIMYFVGAVMKKYEIKEEERKSRHLLLYVLMVILTFTLMIVISYTTHKISGEILLRGFLISYVSPTIIFAAVSLFKYFSKIKLNKATRKIVSAISPLTFGVYLIHTQYFVWGYIENRFTYFADMRPVGMIANTLLTACVIFILCISIDYVRQCLFKVIKIKELSEEIESKVSDMIKK